MTVYAKYNCNSGQLSCFLRNLMLQLASFLDVAYPSFNYMQQLHTVEMLLEFGALVHSQIILSPTCGIADAQYHRVGNSSLQLCKLIQLLKFVSLKMGGPCIKMLILIWLKKLYQSEC